MIMFRQTAPMAVPVVRSIGIFEDAASSSTRSANGISLGEAGGGGEGLSNNDGADGVRDRFVKLQ